MTGDRTSSNRNSVDRTKRRSGNSGPFGNAFMPRMNDSEPGDLSFPLAASGSQLTTRNADMVSGICAPMLSVREAGWKLDLYRQGRELR